MNTHHETSYHEVVPTQDIVSAIEPDQHDRILVDPAYRLWRFKTKEDQYRVITQIMQEVGYQNHDVAPKVRIPTTKLAYETTIEAEKALAILQRQQSRFARFQVRELLDYENHERRERRMLAKAKERWDSNYTYFFGGLTEEEQRYNDYFKTDNEIEPEDEVIEQKLDEMHILSLQDYNPKRFDFQEGYTHNPEDDQSSLLEKKLFQFRFRQAHDPSELFVERQKRMMSRQLARINNPEYKAVFDQLEEAHQTKSNEFIMIAESKFYDVAAQEAFLLYKDYYEGDASAEIEIVEALYKSNPRAFLPIYTNYAAQLHQSDGYQSFPKPTWDTSSGVFANLIEQTIELSEIKPLAQQLESQSHVSNVLPKDEQELFELGLIEAKQQAQKSIEGKKKRQ